MTDLVRDPYLIGGISILSICLAIVEDPKGRVGGWETRISVWELCQSKTTSTVRGDSLMR